MLLHIVDDKFKQESEHYQGKPKFRPSSLGTKCHRKVYYSYYRVKPDYPANPKLKRYGDSGTMHGEYLSNLFRESGHLIDYYNPDGTIPIDFWDKNKLDREFPIIDKDLNMVCKVDGVLIIDKKLWLGEWKTATTKSFADLKAPKESHFIQGSLYQFMFEKALKEGQYSHIKELNGFTKIEGISYIYMNKDDLNMKEYCFTNKSPLSKKAFIETIQKMKSVESHVINNTLPPITKDWCNSCEFRDKCLQNYKVEVK